MNEFYTIPEDYQKRPLKRGKDLVRDDARDRGRINSPTLNGGSLMAAGLSLTQNDRRYLTGQKLELLGNREGFYLRNGTQTMSEIPVLINKIKQIEAQISDHKFQQERQGRAPSVPPELAAEQSRLMGTLDVCLEELRDVQRRLDTFVEQEQITDDSFVLAYGPRCTGKLRGGQLAVIDGQNVSRTADGVLIINDLRSQYNGMSVLDFRQLAATWQAERKEADRLKLLALQASAKEQGQQVPQNLPVSGHKKISKGSLPPFPGWAVNYLKLDDVQNDTK